MYKVGYDLKKWQKFFGCFYNSWLFICETILKRSVIDESLRNNSSQSEFSLNSAK